MAVPLTSSDQASTWLRPDQVERLRTACYDDRFQSTLWQRNEAAIAVLYDTGLRVSELVQLDIDHLHRETSTVRLPAAEQSGRRTKAPPTPDTLELDQVDALGTVRLLVSYLNNREDDSSVLFPSRNGGRLTPKAVRDVVTNVAKTAEIRPYTPTGRGGPADVSPQTLRHSTAWRLLYVEDRSLTDVRDRLRHSALSTTRSLYADLDIDGGPQTRSSTYASDDSPERSPIGDVLDAVPDILYAFDTSGRIVWWNDRVTAVTGYTDEEIVDMHPLDFVAQKDTERIAEAIAHVTDGKVIEHRDALLVTKDEDYLPYEFTGAPLTDEDGTIWGVAGVGRDITGRKRFERISDGFYAVDTDWQFTYLNPRAETLLGQSEEELLGTVVWEEFPEATGMQVYDEFKAAMETQEPVSFDQYYSPWDTWFDIRAYPSETGLSVYFQDITDRKEREQELEQYRTLTEAVTDVLVTIDDDSRIQAVNPAVTDVFGYEPAELLGEPLTRLMPDDLGAEHRATLQQYLDTGERTLDWSNVEVPGIRADGSEVPLAISFSEAEYDDQRFFTGVVRDITERKERERELAYQKALLEAQAETTIHGLLVVDSDRNVLYHNERFMELWDIPEEVVSARSDDVLIEYVHDTLAEPEEFRETVEFLYEHPEEESRDTIELVDGRWFDRYSAPVVTDDTHYGRLWVFRDITDRKDRERELEHQRAALAQLDQFNTLVQDLVHAVVEESTRTEIEQTVCNRLAASDFYQAAWIGEQPPSTAGITPQVRAGIDPDPVPKMAAVTGTESSQGLAERAAEIRDVCVVQTGGNETGTDARRERLHGADIESALAVPIEYGDALYGVLVVYATSPAAFGDRQQTSFADLGETIGFAITAAERKDALVADTVLELTLGVRDPDQFFIRAATEFGGTVRLEGIAGPDENTYLEYVTVSDAAPEELRDLAERTEGLDHFRVVSTHETGCLCEMGMTGSSIVSTVAEHGGTVTDMTAGDGHGTVRLELPRTADIGRVIDALEATVADVDLQAKRTVDRQIQTERRFQATVTDRLTEKQRNSLETAYLAGFFEQPRHSTGEVIAESLGISPSTFHQHLRVGLRKLVSPIVETPSEDA